MMNFQSLTFIKMGTFISEIVFAKECKVSLAEDWLPKVVSFWKSSFNYIHL